jgi:hypothetical protein
VSSAFRRYVRRHHLALLALFVALGGTAYAAVQLERNQVKSRHIGPGQVKKPDIAARAVNSAKVANRTLRRIDFAPGHLPAGATGATGATGPSGLTESSSNLAADTVTVTGCGDGVIRTLPITVTEPSRILATAQSRAVKSSADAKWAALAIDLLDAGSTVVGYAERYPSALPTQSPDLYQINSVGLIKDLATLSPLTVEPGSYTLRLSGQNFNACGGNINYQSASLDYVLLGSG